MVNLSFDAGRTTSRRQGKKKKRLTPKGLDGRNRLVRLEESTIKAKRKRGPNEEALAIYDLNPPKCNGCSGETLAKGMVPLARVRRVRTQEIQMGFDDPLFA